MTLGELIKELAQYDPRLVLPSGFSRPHSYRGYYDELAFEPTNNVTIGDVLKDARGAVGKTFTGYKGGEYTMHEHTPVWLAERGDGGGETIGPALLEYMLRDARAPEGSVP